MLATFSLATAPSDDPSVTQLVRFADDTCFQRIRMHIRRRADVYAYAHFDGAIIGTLGVHRGDTNPELIFELCDPPDAYARLAGTEHPDRSLLAELGTRAVAIPDGTAIKSRDVSLAMIARAIIAAHDSGIRHLGFVSNLFSPALAATLGIPLVTLGTPDYKSKDDTFQENMRHFSTRRQACYGCSIVSTQGCHDLLDTLQKQAVLTLD